MSNVAIAIQGLLALTDIVVSATMAAREFARLVETARQRGTDITDEELAQLEARRKAAVARWRGLAP